MKHNTNSNCINIVRMMFGKINFSNLVFMLLLAITSSTLIGCASVMDVLAADRVEIAERRRNAYNANARREAEHKKTSRAIQQKRADNYRKKFED